MTQMINLVYNLLLTFSAAFEFRLVHAHLNVAGENMASIVGSDYIAPKERSNLAVHCDLECIYLPWRIWCLPE